MKKAVVFILDGLGDRPSAALRGMTPLQAAQTPTLDRLARAHQSGLMDPLRPGLAVDTHTGSGILFGLPPRAAIDLRRGPIEAAGIELETRAGDVLLRANFASVEAHGARIVDRRAGRIGAEAGELCAALQNIEVAHSVVASVHPATQHRAVLRLRGADLSAAISDTDPGGGDMARGILTSKPDADAGGAAQRAADALNEFTARAHAILQPHPINAARAARGAPLANALIARSAGMQCAWPNLLSDLGLRAAAVAGESTILGLARLFGFGCCTSARFTALPDTDLAEKLRAAAAALAGHDLVYVHIKGTDTAAHDRDPALKAEFIARFDRALGDALRAAGFGDAIIGVCADHSTDSNSGEHTGDPVPVLIANADGRRDAVAAYNEIDCIGGALGRITAQGFLTCVLDAMGALANYKPTAADGAL